MQGTLSERNSLWRVWSGGYGGKVSKRNSSRDIFREKFHEVNVIRLSKSKTKLFKGLEIS